MTREPLVVVIAILGSYVFVNLFMLYIWPLHYQIPMRGSFQVWAVYCVFKFLMILTHAAIFGSIVGRYTHFPIVPLGLTMGILSELPGIVSWPSVVGWSSESIGLTLSKTAHIVTYSQWVLTPVLFILFVRMGRIVSEKNS